MRTAGLILLLAFSGAAAARPPVAAPAVHEEARRTTVATVFGADPCPKAVGDEIVVCGRLPEAERFRIPKSLRQSRASGSATPWAARVAALDDAARPQRPNSCSVVGLGGQTGCSASMIRQWADERRAEGRRAGIEF